MKPEKMISVLCSALLVAALSPAVLALDTVEKNLTLQVAVPDGNRIQVENLLGSVQIKQARRTSDSGTARIEARVVAEAKSVQEAEELAAAIELQQRSEDGASVVHVAYPLDRIEALRPPKAGMKGLVSRWSAALFKGGENNVEYDGEMVAIRKDRKASGLAVHLTVVVPIGSRTTVQQRAGTIQIRYVRGELDLAAVAGDVEVVSSFGRLKVATVDADVRVASFQGQRMEVQTGTGLVDVEAIRIDGARLQSHTGTIRGNDITVDEFIVENVAGEVKFVDVFPRTAEVGTESGNVDLALRLKNAKRATVRSDTGNIVLRLGEHINFGLAAETKSGEVKTVGMELEVLERDGRTVLLQKGKGGIDLRVAAAAGDVTVCTYDAVRMKDILGR